MKTRISRIPTVLFAITLILAAFVFLPHTAYAADSTIAPSNDPYSAAPDTYVYISCPIEIYRETADGYAPAEQLIDDFEDIPEHWLYVLTPLAAAEKYYCTLDLGCRIETAPLKNAKVSAIYSSYLPDGDLGSLRIEVAEEIAPHTFLVYYGEIKYISDGTLCLAQDSYGGIYDHHVFYFGLTTADLPANTQPLSEQRAYRLSDPAVILEVTVTGDAERIGSVYDEELLESDYMYPFRRYEKTTEATTLGSVKPTVISTRLGPPNPEACRCYM